MDIFKKDFNQLSLKYERRHAFFKKKIDRWLKSGQSDLYKDGIRLLEDADKFLQEIKERISVTAEGQVNSEAVKQKIKEFKAVYKELYELMVPTWRQWTNAIFVALIAAVILRNFIFGLYHVPTGSAEPGILVGDRIWGNKAAYYFDKVKHGDLVIFDNPEFVYDRSNIVKFLWQKYVGLSVPFL